MEELSEVGSMQSQSILSDVSANNIIKQRQSLEDRTDRKSGLIGPISTLHSIMYAEDNILGSLFAYLKKFQRAKVLDPIDLPFFWQTLNA